MFLSAENYLKISSGPEEISCAQNRSASSAKGTRELQAFRRDGQLSTGTEEFADSIERT